MIAAAGKIFAQARRVLWCLLLVPSVAIILGAVGSVRSEPRLPNSSIPFNIPAQPLVTALEAYVASSSLEVFYDSNLVSGKKSTAVVGLLAPDVALRILLEGTALTVIYAENAFSLVQASNELVAGENTARNVYETYFGIIQGRIEEAFCSRTETVPGSYRLAITFRIGPDGAVLQPRLLSTTGSVERDRILTTVLAQINVGAAPPRGMPQPISLLITPRPPVQTGDCQRPDIPRARS